MVKKVNNLGMLLSAPDRVDYADSVAFIRVKEKRDLLNSSRRQEFLSMNPAEILDKLRQDLLSEGAGSEYQLDATLGELLEKDYAEVEKFDHRGMVVPMLRFRHDIHNLKAFIKNKFTGAAPLLSHVGGVYPQRMIEDHVINGKKIGWPEPIGSALEKILDETDGRRLGDWIDLELDISWIKYCLASSRENKLPLLVRYFMCLEDFAAIKYLWRRSLSEKLNYGIHSVCPKIHLLDDGILSARSREDIADSLLTSDYAAPLADGIARWRDTGSWMALGRDMDDFLMTCLAASRYICLGPEPLAAYLLARENDLLNIRLIHVFKCAGFPEETIREFQRRCHV